MTAHHPDDPITSESDSIEPRTVPVRRSLLERMGLPIVVWSPRRATVAPVRVEQRGGNLYVRQNRPRPGR